VHLAAQSRHAAPEQGHRISVEVFRETESYKECGRSQSSLEKKGQAGSHCATSRGCVVVRCRPGLQPWPTPRNLLHSNPHAHCRYRTIHPAVTRCPSTTVHRCVVGSGKPLKSQPKPSARLRARPLTASRYRGLRGTGCDARRAQDRSVRVCTSGRITRCRVE
jgi:hypothetical protein